MVIRIIYGAQFARSRSAALAGAGLAPGAVERALPLRADRGGAQQAEMLCSALGAGVALAGIPVGYLIGGLEGAAVGLVLAEAVVLLAGIAPVRAPLHGAGYRQRFAQRDASDPYARDAGHKAG